MNQKNLESFLIVAEQLQLNGLVTEEAESKAEQNKEEEIFEKDEIATEMFERKPREAFSEEGLAKMVKSMMGKSEKMISRNIRGKIRSQKASVCRYCGKEGPFTTIQDHIEANHIEGICLPCNFCDTTCTSRFSLRWHKRKYHSTGNMSH